ncbi:MAG: TatD family hydrolase [Candidatus Bathyarchaeota archaeon]|nr:MAG: TatD family hydrolase [Candidatus Bathyarchaeota archaeon]
MLVDTHAHLQWTSFDKDRDRVIRRARSTGVSYIVNIGFNVESSKRAVQLAKENSGLFATIGVHPHNADGFNEVQLKRLKELLKDEKVVAVGETGLDYYRNLSSRIAQKRVFIAQLQLAEQFNLPAVIHNRDAHQDVYQILREFQGKLRFIMHCYSGSLEMTKRFNALGCYFSFAGPVTFPNSRRLQQTVKTIDLHRVLVETDCPWLAPQSVRGKRNEPANLPYVVKKIAELRDLSVDKFSKATTENAREIYKLTTL